MANQERNCSNCIKTRYNPRNIFLGAYCLNPNTQPKEPDQVVSIEYCDTGDFIAKKNLKEPKEEQIIQNT